MATSAELKQKYGVERVTDLLTRGNNGDIEATRQLADWELPAAQLIMGKYWLSIGQPEKAVNLMMLAANQGYVEAASDLGDVYRMGIGLTMNHNMAIKMYKIADGHITPTPDATLRLGIYYCTGEHIERNLTEGKRLIEKALKEKAESQEEFDPTVYSDLGHLYCSSYISKNGDIPSLDDVKQGIEYLDKALPGLESIGHQPLIKIVRETLERAYKQKRQLEVLSRV